MGTWLPSGDGEECGFRTVQSNIVGGQDCKLGDCPWMALIYYQTDQGVTLHGCGGSVINKFYVLTAAHCVGPHDNPFTFTDQGIEFTVQ